MHKPQEPSTLNPEEQFVIEFVQEKAQDLPIRVRVKLYRGLADLVPSKEEALRKSLTLRAAILEEAESKCQELGLKFKPNPKHDGQPTRGHDGEKS